MAPAAINFIVGGGVVVGFGLFSLGNVVVTDHEHRYADPDNPRFRMARVRIVIVGFGLTARGVIS